MLLVVVGTIEAADEKGEVAVVPSGITISPAGIIDHRQRRLGPPVG